MIRGFVMTLELAQEFFKRCLEAEAVTEPERIKILNEMAREFTTDVETFVTDMSEEQVIEQLSENNNVYVAKRRKKR